MSEDRVLVEQHGRVLKIVNNDPKTRKEANTSLTLVECVNSVFDLVGARTPNCHHCHKTIQ